MQRSDKYIVKWKERVFETNGKASILILFEIYLFRNLCIFILMQFPSNFNLIDPCNILSYSLLTINYL